MKAVLGVAVWGVAAAKVAFHLATAGVWGFHRDEFYYLAGGRRLAWGYVDHPPLTPFLYRVGESVFGDSQVGLRVVPALCGGLLVVLAALLARELGGGRRAALLAAVVAALGPLYLTTSHFLGTVTVDLLAWAAATLLVVRIVRTGDARLWVAVGAVVGLGLLNKHTMAFWVAGVGVGLLVSEQRRLLWSPWALAGGAVAAVLVAPHLAWQVQHDWPTLEFARRLREDTMGENVGMFLPLQLGMATLAGTLVWVVGLRSLGGSPRYRWLAVAYGVLFVVLWASGGKPYYLGPLYVPLVAAGAVVVEGWRRWGVVVGAVVVTGLLTLPLFTPVLPAESASSLAEVNDDLGGMLGWNDVARQIGDVARSLPGDVVVLTASYSQAGAVEYWRDSLGLPPAVSGHNSYWLWGHDEAKQGAWVVVVGYRPHAVAGLLSDCRDAGRISGRLMDEEVRGAPMMVCRADRPWADIWPALRHYN